MKHMKGGEVPAPDGDPSVRKANAKKLAAGYTKKKRFLECCYLSLATYLWFTQFLVIARYFVHSGDAKITQLAWTPLMMVCAMTLADFIGGIAHWGLDTWGTPDTPVFGNFIRSFREHHVDQAAMTKHDFIETNADTTLPLIPVLLLQRYFLYYGARSSTTAAAAQTIGEGHSSSSSSYAYNVSNENVGMHVFLLTLTLCIAFTNEIHKWSHEAKPNPVARALMAHNVILTPLGHRRHHRDNHDISYCITTGWLNVFLDKVEFWRKAETVVTALTGAIPRANDQHLLGK
ncbi:putative ubiquitin-conjugating enzyme variant Kua [Trypanosoma theileri]|uniref:Putative ubiquitin-conjugating enzyme variant Kua n=1 Tax=Trypanosoma theileri TaxID=67003 RepID=A0A1X0NXG4_9TRYP|nr:putative ubiquitin-conjugating enzyme variant Kua [Trypanosoma theileri]ORC89382.1 putative ubiquitin-conjugating enzyme variant Kua [Trypanosoma theileri]